jgi:hypothetical protein
MDLSASIDRIVDLGQKKEKIEHIPQASNRLEDTFFVNGEWVTRPRLPDIRLHKCRSIESLVELTEEQSKSSATIWHADSPSSSACHMAALFDDEHRDDCASLTMPWSSWFQLIRSRTLGQAISQEAFVNLLEFELRSRVQDSSLLPLIRNVKFRKTSEGNAIYEATSNTLGAESTVDVSSADGTIPDMFNVRIPIYESEELDTHMTISLALKVNCDNASFGIAPLPGEIACVTHAAQNVIHKHLLARLDSSDSIAVYHGSPHS